MTDTDYSRKLEELDRLLNDPDVALEPDRIWSLLAEISQHDLDGIGGASEQPTRAMEVARAY